MDAHELVEQIRRGGDVRAAQAELYGLVNEKLRPILTSKLSAPLRRRLDVEDVIHEAFVQGIAGLDSFDSRHREAIYAWIYRSARNLLNKQYRRKSVYAVPFAQGRDTSGPRASRIGKRSAGPATMTAGNDWVHYMLKDLKGSEAEIIRLRLFEGLRMREIAKRLGKEPDAVRKFYWRTVRKIQDRLKTSEKDS
jgi:RNA polymerase sigma factor (sigma-70 family)